MLRELRRHGYHLSPGTLYPLLHSMEKEKLLKREEKIVGGKVRKYYTATRKGKRALEQAKEKIAELVEEVLETPLSQRTDATLNPGVYRPNNKW
ncbi:MAG: hypothetical protein Kow0099_20200 [Candidatus Abyssubacteria bacterium]